MAEFDVELAPLKIYDIRRTDRRLGAGAFGTVFEVEWNGTDLRCEVHARHLQRDTVSGGEASVHHSI